MQMCFYVNAEIALHQSMAANTAKSVVIVWIYNYVRHFDCWLDILMWMLKKKPDVRLSGFELLASKSRPYSQALVKRRDRIALSDRRLFAFNKIVYYIETGEHIFCKVRCFIDFLDFNNTTVAVQQTIRINNRNFAANVVILAGWINIINKKNRFSKFNRTRNNVIIKNKSFSMFSSLHLHCIKRNKKTCVVVCPYAGSNRKNKVHVRPTYGNRCSYFWACLVQ